MHIFTLRNKIEGSAEDLNGKLIVIKRNKENGHVYFFDIMTKKALRETTRVVKETETADGLIIETSSGAKYDFIDVQTLIPTYVHGEVKPETPKAPVIDFKVVKSTSSHRNIHYGDGYDMTDYEFDRDITEEEFVEFLHQEGKNIRTTQEYPYQDYAKISGSGNKWQYKWILCYTD